MGGLGQVAHGVLHDARKAGASAEPRLFLGLNTLADRLFPIVGYIGFPTMPGAWRACGENLVAFLEAAVLSLRAQPVPPGSAFGPEYHRLQRLLRQDAIVMAYPAYMVLPGESPAGRAILDNLTEGYLLPEDLDLSPAAQLTELAWAVERSGARRILLLPPGAAGDAVYALNADAAAGRGTVVLDLLAELLDAQCAWTRQVFG